MNAGYRLVAWGTMPLGAGLGGLIANTWSVPTALLSAAVVSGLCTPIVYRGITTDLLATHSPAVGPAGVAGRSTSPEASIGSRPPTIPAEAGQAPRHHRPANVSAMKPEPELIVDGLGLGESPRWHGGRIWYCDWIDGDVVSVAPDGSERQVHAHLDGFPICIDWDPADRLLVVDGAGRRLLRMVDGRLDPVADLSAVSNRPWNEIVTHPSGRVFVNGIGYDLMAGEEPATGQIAVVENDGSIRAVADGLAFPNGMALIEEGATLLVAESHAGRITAFSVGSDGDLGRGEIFASLPGGAPDGLCPGADDTVWYADVPNRRCQRVAAGGRVLETVELDRGCFSCARGPDGSLYVTAAAWDADTFSTRRGVLYRLALHGPG